MGIKIEKYAILAFDTSRVLIAFFHFIYLFNLFPSGKHYTDIRSAPFLIISASEA